MKKIVIIFSFLLIALSSLLVQCKKSIVELNGSASQADFTYKVIPLQDSLPFSYTVTFTNASQEALQYQWDFGDNTTSALQSPQHTYATFGNYNVKLLITNSNECADSIVHSVTIIPKPVVDFSVSEIRCTGNPVSFTDHSYVPTGFTGSIKTWV